MWNITLYDLFRKLIGKSAWSVLIIIQCKYSMNTKEYKTFFLQQNCYETFTGTAKPLFYSLRLIHRQIPLNIQAILWYRVVTWTIKTSTLSDWGQARLHWKPLAARLAESQNFHNFFLHPSAIKSVPRLTVRYL